MSFLIGEKIRIKHDSEYYCQCPDTIGTIVISCFETKFNQFFYKGDYYNLTDGYNYVVEFTDGYINSYRDSDLEYDWAHKTRLGELL